MNTAPIITTVWRGGARIKIDRVPATTKGPAATKFRVFAGAVQGATGTRSLAAQFYSGYHNGPKSERTIIIPDRDDKPDSAAILSAIESLHRRWPKLWFYDTTGLNLEKIIPSSHAEPADLNDRIDDIL